MQISNNWFNLCDLCKIKHKTIFFRVIRTFVSRRKPQRFKIVKFDYWPTGIISGLMCILSAPKSQKLESHLPKKCLIYIWGPVKKKKKKRDGDGGLRLESLKRTLEWKKDAIRRHLRGNNSRDKWWREKEFSNETYFLRRHGRPSKRYLEKNKRIWHRTRRNAPARWTGSASKVINFRFTRGESSSSRYKRARAESY